MRLFGWFNRSEVDSGDPGNATAAQCRELLRALDRLRPQTNRWDDDAFAQQVRLKIAIRDLGPECLDTLLAQLAVQDWGHLSEREMARAPMAFEARQIVLLLIGRFQDPRAIGRLKTEIQLGSARDRTYAIVALGRIGDPSVVEDIAAKLKDPILDVRKVAALALGPLGSVAAVAPLCDALMDPDPSVRGNAAKALGEIGDRSAVERIRQLLSDTDEWPRKRALVALGRLGDERVTEDLVKAAAGPYLGPSDAPLVASLRGVDRRDDAWRCAARVLQECLRQAEQIPKQHFAKATDVVRKTIIAAWWENFQQNLRNAVEILSSGATEEQALEVKTGLLRMVNEYGRRDVLARVRTVHSLDARSAVEVALDGVKDLALEIV